MNLKHFSIILFMCLLSAVGVSNAQTTNEAIQEIKKINLPGVTITDIQDIPAGNYKPPVGKIINNFPAVLRVTCTSKPTTESNIRIEIWMPKENWNGRFLGTGTGGGAGYINYGSLIAGVMRGFATANTDLGTFPGADNAVGHSEVWADFGYRSTHEMTMVSKTILQVYYKKPAYHAYFFSCSTGGQQALMEAQRYPEDYNGIIAGAPANNRTHLHASFIWNSIANKQALGSPVISQKKMELFAKLLIRNNAGKDGGAPGDDFLTDPRLCRFDPEMLPHCPEGIVGDSCFSDPEIAVLKKLYYGPTNPGTGEQIYTPLPLGGTQILSYTPHFYLFKWVFGADFDYSKFDFDQDMAKVDSILGPILNANNPHLDQLKKRGGKILMYTGTADQLVPFQDALNYYERVIEIQKGLKQTQDFFRFFLVPGMGHCGGGPGLTDIGQGQFLEVKQDSEHDILMAMLNWVEKGIAPDRIIATAFSCCDTVNRIRFQRPIYPYPKFPDYIGGDPNLVSSYKGTDHPRGHVLIPSQKYLK
jgi:feruloyl esterase